MFNVTNWNLYSTMVKLTSSTVKCNRITIIKTKVYRVQSLTNSMWLNNTLHAGPRGGQEHLTMLWGKFGVVRNRETADGVQYLAKLRAGFTSSLRWLITTFWLAVHGKPVLFWKGTSGLKFPCFLFMHANGTGPFEFRAVPIL